ncbi:hypothetical protein [Undibacterium sp. Ji22W]|uniref:hypothetical protein n=1 Tax=Undibacterium sp. Ji22W TaxID=3413038 RepID=UPI003BF2FEB0
MFSLDEFARWTLVPIVFTVALNAAHAQSKQNSPLAEVQKTSSIGIEQQWEYIVVSYGKTLFASPQKTLAYRSIGLVSGQEAPDLENSLDILGRFGWEVITIVGSIGGDQQVVLKRKYNRNLVSNEYNAIIKGKDLYIKDLIDIMEREQRLREQAEKNAAIDRNKPRLINLDEVDALARKLENDAELKAAYQEAFAKTKMSKYSTIEIDTRYGVNIILNADVTKMYLQNGNSYRKSDVELFVEALLASFRFMHPAVARYNTVRINLNAIIMFEGNPIIVAKRSTSKYQGSSSDWVDQ